MAILRCPSCFFIKEVPNQYINKTTRCPKCQKIAKVWQSEQLFNALFAKTKTISKNLGQIKLEQQQTTQELMDSVKECNQLKQKQKKTQHQLLQTENTVKQLRTAHKKNKQKLSEAKREYQQLEQKTQKKNTQAGYVFAEQDYAKELNDFQPLVEWFKRREIELQPNKAASDISGYFDEMAVALGDNIDALYELLQLIKRQYNKGNKRITLNLSTYKQEHLESLGSFCETAYRFAFFKKYFHKKDGEMTILLSDIPQIQKFFQGDWLEWYGFMKVASYLVEQKKNFSCTRSSQVQFKTHRNELDIFFLINGKSPIWIECKTGEFRDSINKYQQLRKQLNLTKKRAILLVSGLYEQEAKVMSNMYYLTFVNEKMLIPHLKTVLE